MTAPLEVPIPVSGIADVVAAARSGSTEAFSSLYQRFCRSVHSILLSRLNPEEAQEATQEVFIVVHRRLQELRDASAFGPWVHSIARNAAASRIRTAMRRPREEALPDVAGPGARDESELRDRVLRHLQGLPEAYRETLAMRLIDGMTGPEIADATGLTAASVRVNLHRGMELLRPLLLREGWP